LSKPPTTRRGVFSGVLDHKLNVRRGPGHERLGASKDFVVFLRRNLTPCQPGNDGACFMLSNSVLQAHSMRFPVIAVWRTGRGNIVGDLRPDGMRPG
jgi:hypothetical protein